jgi:hypothetical protein
MIAKASLTLIENKPVCPKLSQMALRCVKPEAV